MSRYEDPAGEEGRSGSRLGRGDVDDTGNWDASGRSRRGRKPWEPSDRHAAGMGERPTGIRRILGRHPVLSILGILATLTITFVSLSAYAAYRGVYDSIHHLDVTARELGHRPPKLNGSEDRKSTR